MTFDRHAPSVEGFTGKPTIHRAIQATLADKAPAATSQSGAWWQTTSNLFDISGSASEFLVDYGLGHKGIRVVDKGTYTAFECDPGYYMVIFSADLESNSTAAQPRVAMAVQNLDDTIDLIGFYEAAPGVDSPSAAIRIQDTSWVDFQDTKRIVVGGASGGTGSVDFRNVQLIIVKMGDRDG